jgi:hypothetical protein
MFARWRGAKGASPASLRLAVLAGVRWRGAPCQLSKPFKPAAAVIQERIKVRIIPGRIDQLLSVAQSLVAWIRRAASQNQSKERHANEGSASEGYVSVAHRLIAYGDFISYRNLSQ